MKISPAMSRIESRESGKPRHLSLVTPHSRRAFTMIEIAICLAIIGIALVGIIAALPIGLNTSRDNREETIIAQDANVLLELIRNGSHGADDLTNYVYAVTNSWTFFNANGGVVNSGVYGYASPGELTNGMRIIGLLSLPEYTDSSGLPIPSLIEGGISNHIVARVRSLSGLAAEKPPQGNSIMQDNSFSYQVLFVNAPLAMELPPLFRAGNNYNVGATVYTNQSRWRAVNNTSDIPGQTANWVRYDRFADQLAASQREIRLRFRWPQLPNGNVGANYQNFRATVGGQIEVTNYSGHLLYFYQSQSFTKAQ